MIFIVCVIFGILIDFVNNIAIKATINRFLAKKSKKILYLSLSLRIIFLLTLFIMIAKINVKYLIFTFIGLILSKIYLLIKRVFSHEYNNR